MLERACGGGRGGGTVKRVECALSYLVKGFHTGSVISMSSCARKPLLITCSTEDKSIRLWNYRQHVCVDALTFENDAQREFFFLCVSFGWKKKTGWQQS